MSPLERIIELLTASGPRPRRSGANWITRCPAHADRRPSLSLRQTDAEVVLLHCFAGCATDDVLRALGLEYRDLYPDSRVRSYRVPGWVIEIRGWRYG